MNIVNFTIFDLFKDITLNLIRYGYYQTRSSFYRDQFGKDSTKNISVTDLAQIFIHPSFQLEMLKRSFHMGI